MRETLARAALAASSVLVVLLVLELALRALGYLPERAAGMARVHDKDWTTLIDCYPSNPRGYFSTDLRTPENKARLQWLAPRRYDAIARRAPYAVEFRYNAFRFRDREPEPKTPGRTRVVVVGDSFTEGQGVIETDTTARVLEAELNARDPDRWEVRNCGRRATDFPALNAVFEDALHYEPDIVVYAMVLNDGDRAPEFQARQRYVNDWILDNTRAQDDDEPRFRSRLWGLVRERWDRYAIGRASTRWYQEMYGFENAEGWARTQQHIREMDIRTRAGGGRFLMALWPLLVDLDAAYPFAEAHARIQAFCRSARITLVDLRPVLATHRTEALWVHPLDRHPNEIAHRAAAQALAPAVRNAY